MPPTLMHHDANGVAFEHRELHNMYGMFMTMATQQGQKLAYPTRRPFVLTRAFFAGSQRYAAVWTGDNKASWAPLAAGTLVPGGRLPPVSAGARRIQDQAARAMAL